jgi:hypothetical protein
MLGIKISLSITIPRPILIDSPISEEFLTSDVIFGVVTLGFSTESVLFDLSSDLSFFSTKIDFKIVIKIRSIAKLHLRH